jgi:hypothetical protein
VIVDRWSKATDEVENVNRKALLFERFQPLFERFEPLLIIDQRSPIWYQNQISSHVQVFNYGESIYECDFLALFEFKLGGKLKIRISRYNSGKKFSARTELKIWISPNSRHRINSYCNTRFRRPKYLNSARTLLLRYRAAYVKLTCAKRDYPSTLAK